MDHRIIMNVGNAFMHSARNGPVPYNAKGAAWLLLIIL